MFNHGFRCTASIRMLQHLTGVERNIHAPPQERVSTKTRQQHSRCGLFRAENKQYSIIVVLRIPLRMDRLVFCTHLLHIHSSALPHSFILNYRFHLLTKPTRKCSRSLSRAHQSAHPPATRAVSIFTNSPDEIASQKTIITDSRSGPNASDSMENKAPSSGCTIYWKHNGIYPTGMSCGLVPK